MPRSKITKTRTTGVARAAAKRLLENAPAYEKVLLIADQNFLRIRAMEFLANGDTDKATDMLLLDKILA